MAKKKSKRRLLVYLNEQHGELHEAVVGSRMKLLNGILQKHPVIKRWVDWGLVRARRSVGVEVVRRNAWTVVVRLPDGNVIKRKLERDECRQETIIPTI